ncbi:hypothetical protein MA16_Dca016423 [Dendrobium catenatum]|uniref:Uncharacterized protein n=1 Tax=Dendrobium catenatum TaxID=906689 RepID=A0A2I0VVD2_9ASPA|nr:hypothetical protein MA16_Dca016423 [Dendrobium catenatum]
MSNIYLSITLQMKLLLSGGKQVAVRRRRSDGYRVRRGLTAIGEQRKFDDGIGNQAKVQRW